MVSEQSQIHKFWRKSLLPNCILQRIYTVIETSHWMHCRRDCLKRNNLTRSIRSLKEYSGGLPGVGSSAPLFHSRFLKGQGEKIWPKKVVDWDKDRDIFTDSQNHSGLKRPLKSSSPTFNLVQTSPLLNMIECLAR